MTPSIDRIDASADAIVERFRGNPVADRIFYTASTFGDFSLIWHLLNVVLVLVGMRTRRQAVGFALAIGAESLIVNQGIKRLFRRSRPHPGDEHPHHVRTPSTSSFPSGHASSAVVAATLLSADHPLLRPLFYAIAAVVALSRPYVRAHHASDIVGGALCGFVLARVLGCAIRVGGRSIAAGR
jgi:membrane-associated phospholipid phosphatase